MTSSDQPTLARRHVLLTVRTQLQDRFAERFARGRLRALATIEGRPA